jgi:hypothetical protein
MTRFRIFPPSATPVPPEQGTKRQKIHFFIFHTPKHRKRRTRFSPKASKWISSYRRNPLCPPPLSQSNSQEVNRVYIKIITLPLINIRFPRLTRRQHSLSILYAASTLLSNIYGGEIQIQKKPPMSVQ